MSTTTLTIEDNAGSLFACRLVLVASGPLNINVLIILVKIWANMKLWSCWRILFCETVSAAGGPLQKFFNNLFFFSVRLHLSDQGRTLVCAM